MPRSGGESDKLGNRYEGWWTVQNLLDLLIGDAIAVEPESFEESRGVEFIKTLRDGSQEFHSVKRQRAGHGWRLSDLVRLDARGRSVLKDLFDKVDANPTRMVVFVSTTIHSQAYEVWDRSHRSQTTSEFERQLETDKGLHEDFTKYVLPLAKDKIEEALRLFRSFRLVPMGEDELRRQVERTVRLLLYRTDGVPVDAAEVVLKLADYICDSLGRRVVEADIRGHLARHGYHLKDWSRDTNAAQQMERLNTQYLRRVDSELILGRAIPRPEAITVADALQSATGKLAQLIVAAAGAGKSCTLAQVLDTLRRAGVPFVVIRLDNLPLLSSTKALGRQLELPDSPALVLAGLAQGKRAVLVVDQLDAMSVVSGRNAELWQVFDELLEEVRHHPSLRLLLACREFDLENDPRLAKLVKNEGPAERVDLGLLSLETVRSVVNEGGGDPGRLSAPALELLRTPFHLYLFLHGDPANPAPFGGRQELFTRFWKAKRAKATQAGIDFERVVGVLSDELSRSESISVPADRLDSVAADAAALVSENVLVLENGRFRFFHESFFDYAFARRFVRDGRDLVRFLTEECSEQHLFRRAQVRQILAYQRDADRAAYLRTLGALLDHSRVRLHLKKLALDWLAQLDDPSEEEWNLVMPLLSNSPLNWAAFNVLWGKVPWFDLLQRIHVLPKLLADPDAGFVDRCVRALSQKEFLEQRSAQIADLLRPYRGKGETWNRRFREVLQFGHFHHSREMFDFVLELQQDGLFDDEGDDLRWHSLTEMAEQRSEFAVEFLARSVERIISQAAAHGETNPFSEDRRKRRIDRHFIHTTAQRSPMQFAERIVPIVKLLVLSNAQPAKCGGYYDEVWHYLTFGTEHDTHEALLGSARRALQEVARINPQQCDVLLAGWEELNHKTLRFLLLSAWSENPTYFAARAAAYFIRYPLAFLVGYDFIIGDGAGRNGVTLPLLKAISPLIEADAHSKLEAAIHGYANPYEKDRPNYRGSHELTLWLQLDPERLGKSSKMRIEELQRKFPERKLTSAEKRTDRRTGHFVPPPIPARAFDKMTDDQWIEAFRTYDSPESSRRNGRSIGGAWELHTPLRNAAKSDRKRFAALALRMPEDILPLYFDAILWGLVDESREVIKAGADEGADIVLPNDTPLPTETLLEVANRVHRFPGKPFGRAVCRIADVVAPRSIPVELVEMVGDYALHDPDPKEEIWDQNATGGAKMYGGDPLFAGINSARGSAADSFSRFLFAHPEMADRLLPYVEALARDKSVAVRAVNVLALTALLNTHRDKAVALFAETCEAGDALWAIDPVEDFIYYATFSHFPALQPLLRRMLKSPEKEARHAAARQTTIAAFRHTEAREDLPLVLGGDEECRRAAAEIYAVNVHHESVRDDCVHHLKQLFNDPDKRVRETAADWFHNRYGGWTDWQRDLLASFTKSAAFTDGGVECMMSLEKTPSALPPEFLDAAQHAVDLFEVHIQTNPPYAFGFAYSLPALVIRFYEQTKDEAAKKVCLDLLDRMLALGWGEAASELSSIDR